MENHYFNQVNPLEMAIFNSYVKLPEGIVSKNGEIWEILIDKSFKNKDYCDDDGDDKWR